MFRQLRFRPLGWLLALGTIGAMAATLALAPTGGAAPAEVEYKARFTASCLLGPGLLDEEGEVTIQASAMGPSEVEEHGEVSLRDAHATIATPPGWSTALARLGAVTAVGRATVLEVRLTGSVQSTLDFATPAEYPAGLPFEAPVVSAQAMTLDVPSGSQATGSSYTIGPVAVSAKAGEKLRLAVSTRPGYNREDEPTSEGVQAVTSGLNAEGEVAANANAIRISCTADSAAVLGEATVVPAVVQTGTGSSTSTGSTGSTELTDTTTTTQSTTTTVSTATADTTATTVSTGTTETATSDETTTTTAAFSTEALSAWKLKGSIGLSNLGESVALPAGCTFTGQATVPPNRAVVGELTGQTACPHFSATLNLLGLLSTEVGLSLEESTPVAATIAREAFPGSNLHIAGSARERLGVSSLDLLGLSFRVSCQTVESVRLPLAATESALGLATGVGFSGEATIPQTRCAATGGFQALVEALVNLLVVGPHNHFTLLVQAPAALPTAGRGSVAAPGRS